jgi:predicted nucleic acid-binding protein
MGAVRKPLRVYVDTSVFGSVHDAAFAEASHQFFEWVRSGRIVVLVSERVVDEIGRAPLQVRTVLEGLGVESVEQVVVDEDVLALREAYIAAAVVGRTCEVDATHVAAATVARADAIVSWNFRHIVRLDRIKGFHRVNLQEGYGIIGIVSPQEVCFDDDDRSGED